LINANARGINDDGEVVGSCAGSNGPQGCLKNGDIYTYFHYPGAFSTEANGINNAGMVVGDVGIRVVTPEPATMLFLVFGLGWGRRG